MVETSNLCAALRSGATTHVWNRNEPPPATYTHHRSPVNQKKVVNIPWDNSAPVKPKYGTKAHRDQRARYTRQLERDGYLICNQPVCVMSDRTIHQGDRWCAGHDDSGTRYIGPVHATCNERDGAIRGNRMSAHGLGKDRWAL